jgi:hypothetical protein
VGLLKGRLAGATAASEDREEGLGESFLRVHWVAVPKALRARRVNRRARALHRRAASAGEPGELCTCMMAAVTAGLRISSSAWVCSDDTAHHTLPFTVGAPCLLCTCAACPVTTARNMSMADWLAQEAAEVAKRCGLEAPSAGDGEGVEAVPENTSGLSCLAASEKQMRAYPAVAQPVFPELPGPTAARVLVIEAGACQMGVLPRCFL